MRAKLCIFLVGGLVFIVIAIIFLFPYKVDGLQNYANEGKPLEVQLFQVH